MSTLYHEQTTRQINGTLGQFSIRVESVDNNPNSIQLTIKKGHDGTGNFFIASALSEQDLKDFFGLIAEVRSEVYRVIRKDDNA